MKRATHYDSIGLRLDASTLELGPGGDLYVDGVGAHVGLYTYHDDQGRPFIEHVPAETLFEPASLESAAGSDVNIQHPEGLVTEDNYRDVTQGVWVKAWDAGGDQMGVKLRLKSKEAKDMIREAIDGGAEVELSPAYEVDVDVGDVDTPDGRANGTQRTRRYNAMAMLREGQARGGRGMRLALDSGPCAPPGCRVQSFRHQRRDGATSSKRDHMKVKLTHTDGRTVEVDAERAKWLRCVSLDAAAAKKANADKIETGTISILIEGEEATELTLPVSMIEMMLEGIGGGSVSAGPAAPEGREPMEEEMEGMDAGDDEKDRGDSKSVSMDDVKAIVAKALNADAKKRTNQDAMRRTIETDAGGLLPADYTFSVDSWATAGDALARALPGEVAHWAAEVKKAQRGDSFAQGAVSQRLHTLAADKRSGGGIFTKVDNKTPAVNSDGKGPWESGIPNRPAKDAN